MPAAAVKLKAVSEVLPLTRISERLRELAGDARHEHGKT
jgi:chemotaxis response regulator CheB